MRNTDDINFRAGGGGIGFLGCLQIVFIVLKLCHVIDWRWVIVLIPLWIELGLCALILAIVLIWIFMER